MCEKPHAAARRVMDHFVEPYEVACSETEAYARTRKGSPCVASRGIALALGQCIMRLHDNHLADHFHLLKQSMGLLSISPMREIPVERLALADRRVRVESIADPDESTPRTSAVVVIHLKR